MDQGERARRRDRCVVGDRSRNRAGALAPGARGPGGGAPRRPARSAGYEARGRGGPSCPFAQDITAPGAEARIAGRARELEGAGWLDNDAGAFRQSAFQEDDPEATSACSGERPGAGAPHPRPPSPAPRGAGARILNVASLAGMQPTPWFAAYGASKAFVISFSEALSEELRGHVGVTAFCQARASPRFSRRGPRACAGGAPGATSGPTRRRVPPWTRRNGVWSSRCRGRRTGSWPRWPGSPARTGTARRPVGCRPLPRVRAAESLSRLPRDPASPPTTHPRTPSPPSGSRRGAPACGRATRRRRGRGRGRSRRRRRARGEARTRRRPA